MTQEQLNNFLLDSRKSFRNLFIYTERIKDTMMYINSILEKHNYVKGRAIFSNCIKDGTEAYLDCWAWDWLPMYLYEFNFGIKHDIALSMFTVADSGFFDGRNSESNEFKLEVDEFQDVDSSVSKIVFCVQKNDWYTNYPTEKFQMVFSSNVDEFKKIDLENDKYVYARAYDMGSFIDVESIRKNLEDLNEKCKDLGIEGVELKGDLAN